MKRSSDRHDWDLPGTAVLWMLPLILPWFALLDAGVEAPARTYQVLAAGTAAIAALLGTGVWAAWRTRGEGRSHRRRAVLWAFLPTAGMLAVATIGLAESAGLSFLALGPLLTWLLLTALLPYWRDDVDLIDLREPSIGWKRLLGIRMVYANPENPAVWVRMRNPIPFSTDIGLTPNLGNFWGWLVAGVLFLSLTASLGVSIVAWLPR